MGGALNERDTIAAIATPPGTGGVGIVRVSGPRALAIVADAIGKQPESLEDRRMTAAVARDVSGARIDQVLAVAMRGPRSFTGEDVGELHGHGGAVNMGRLLRATLDRGARMAEAGEFTRRAFENGRLDLAAAEALLGVIEATSERAWRVARAQLAGELGAVVARKREAATALLAEAEAAIDFPEEGNEYLGARDVARRAVALAGELDGLADTFAVGRVLREGIRAVLVGPVNAGKSSLFNQLLGRERALVAEEPGTTRDFVEATAVWGGVSVTLGDTAGERVAGSSVEQKGIELGRAYAAEADVIVDVREASEGAAVLDDPRVVSVASKIDLAGAGVAADARGRLATSAKTGAGVSALRDAIVAAAAGRPVDSAEDVVVTSERQRRHLVGAAEALRRAAGAVEQHPLEVVALELRDAASELAAITGEGVGEEVLDALFSRFCIGK